MSCPCRTTSLKVFIKSLTDLRLSDPAVDVTRTVQSRYTRAVGLRSQFILARPYTATAALHFPRRISPKQTLRALPSKSSATFETPEVTQNDRSNDATINQPSPEAFNASRHKYAAAKSKGAILEFSEISPESIDSLVADLEESPPPEPLPPNLKFGPAVHDEPKPASKPPEPVKESSRLKRMKIMQEKKRKIVMRHPRAHKKEYWRIQKEALKEKFPEGWMPRKRLSPDALDGIRALHAQFPDYFTTEELSEKFMVSPEAIRRILRGKWQPSPEEEEDRQRRWFGRGKNIWSQMAAIGRKPPRRWRQEGIVRDAIWNIRKGPRTQPPKQRKPRHYDVDVDRSFVENTDNAFIGESIAESEPIDANEEFHRKMKMQSNRRFNKGPNRKFNRDSGKKFVRDSYRDSYKKPDTDSDRKFNKDSNRDFTKDSTKESRKESKKEPNKVPDNRDAFDRAFDARFDPDSHRGSTQKSQW
ncbi:hypothetical protein F4805DRAFT_433289 [Annulohypoxylon moriforme]|nr:hypothetical protein F4805DRAFT_433289 [Annulohypoxylon moriforme]